MHAYRSFAKFIRDLLGSLLKVLYPKAFNLLFTLTRPGINFTAEYGQQESAVVRNLSRAIVCLKGSLHVFCSFLLLVLFEFFFLHPKLLHLYLVRVPCSL